MTKPRYIAWTGGSCPVTYGTPIETVDRDGTVAQGQSGDHVSKEPFWTFSRDCDADDHIIAYRVIEQE